jgi:UDP-glucose 4-epimerase
VTGALGHIGSALIRAPHILSIAESITLIDDLRTQRFFSLFNLPDPTKFHLIEGNVLELELGKVIEQSDAVIHLAATTDAARSLTASEEVWRNNHPATLRIAEICADAGVPIVFPSSTSVYGSQSGPVDEGAPFETLNPESPYAASKLHEEAEIQRLVQEKDLKATILRFGTIFGVSRGMRFHTAVNRFCWQAAKGEPITVWREAVNGVRPYLEIADAVRAIGFSISGGGFGVGPTNIVTLNAEIEEILNLIREVIPGVEVELIDSPLLNQASYHVSAGKSEGQGFRYVGDLREGILSTLRLIGLNNLSSMDAL